MTNLVVTSSFKRAYKRTIKKRPDLKTQLETTLKLLATDPYHTSLRTHKLKGKLSGAWACSVESDYRIVFNFGTSDNTGNKEIVLIDIGTHDEVY